MFGCSDLCSNLQNIILKDYMIHHHQCECCVNGFNVKCFVFLKNCYTNPIHYHLFIFFFINLKIAFFFTLKWKEREQKHALGNMD